MGDGTFFNEYIKFDELAQFDEHDSLVELTEAHDVSLRDFPE